MNDKFDQYKYINEYSRDHYRQFNFRVSKEYDQDIIQAIEDAKSIGISMNAFIRECIRLAINDDGFIETTVGKVEQLRNSRI